MNVQPMQMSMMPCSSPVMQFDMPRTGNPFAADYLDLPIRQNEETLEEF